MSVGVILAKIFLWGLGGVILVLCGTMTGFWPVIFNFQLKQELILTNSSRSFDLWKGTPIPMYLEIYMFNWTNPNETLTSNAKPNFLELGPYVFSEVHKKENMVWNTNGTITFKQRRTWHFVPEKSKGSVNDKITNVNVIALIIGNIISTKVSPKYLPIIDKFVSIEEKDVYTTKTVQELLFDGYSDKILDIVIKLEKMLKIKIPFDKFGWFYSRNGSLDYDGVFNMKTGSTGLEDLGEIVGWNYNSRSPSYSGQCGNLDGTSGELWPLDGASKQYAKIFTSDLCSSLTLKKNGDSEVNGLLGSRFSADNTMLDNGELVADNKCFCSEGLCPPNGARDISKCRFGAPAFISLPHFYLADSSYANNVSGMAPNPQKHDFYLILEKITSIPLEVHARLQINILCKPIKGMKFFEQLPHAYMPMLWFDERAAVTPALSKELSPIVTIATVVEPALIGLTVLGGVMVIIGLVLWRFHFFKKNDDEPLISESSS